MGSPWNDLVKEKFRLGRMINPKYSLKQAMKSAKKVYKKTKKALPGLKKKLNNATRGGGKNRRRRKSRGRK